MRDNVDNIYNKYSLENYVLFFWRRKARIALTQSLISKLNAKT